ncbi:MAG: M48 family metalloprotease [Candidatus Anstonellales archaeon]
MIIKPKPFISPIVKNTILTLIILIFPLIIMLFVSLVFFRVTDLIVLVVYILVFAIIEIGFLFLSKDIIMRVLGARRIQTGWIVDMVRDVASKANLPMPEVYIIPDLTPNAFAVGISPSRSAIGINSGLVDLLQPNELRGVIAHEVAHIKNRDTLIMTVAVILFNSLGLITDYVGRVLIFSASNSRNSGQLVLIGAAIWIFSLIVRLILAPIILLALSRTREYVADETGARLIRDPISLADALIKIHNFYHNPDLPPYESTDPINKSLSMMYIGSIEPKKTGFWEELFSTHPPVEKRVERLTELAKELRVYKFKKISNNRTNRGDVG